MTESYRIKRARNDEATAQGLSDVLLDVVEGGASVGFMLPVCNLKGL